MLAASVPLSSSTGTGVASLVMRDFLGFCSLFISLVSDALAPADDSGTACSPPITQLQALSR